MRNLCSYPGRQQKENLYILVNERDTTPALSTCAVGTPPAAAAAAATATAATAAAAEVN